jgi:hypothetical protein
VANRPPASRQASDFTKAARELPERLLAGSVMAGMRRSFVLLDW